MSCTLTWAKLILRFTPKPSTVRALAHTLTLPRKFAARPHPWSPNSQNKTSEKEPGTENTTPQGGVSKCMTNMKKKKCMTNMKKKKRRRLKAPTQHAIQRYPRIHAHPPTLQIHQQEKGSMSLALPPPTHSRLCHTLSKMVAHWWGIKRPLTSLGAIKNVKTYPAVVVAPPVPPAPSSSPPRTPAPSSHTPTACSPRSAR